MVYFKIGSTEFIGELTPSSISPSVEIIKNEERSLDGTMNIDVVGRKIQLKVTWDMLSEADMQQLLALEQSANVLSVEYYDAKTSGLKKMNAYVNGIEYTPYFQGDVINWQNVSLSLVEI